MTTVVWPSEELSVLDDWALVRASVEGDAAAFGQLLRRHDDKMRGVVWRIVGSQAAMDDVLQEAYLKAWRGLAGYEGKSAFSSWLYTIAHRAALDWLRSERRHARAPTNRVSADLSIQDHAAALAERDSLRHSLAKLPPDQLAVVALIDGDGRSYEEVAALLDINPGTVASRLHRARLALRVSLTDCPTEAEEDLT